MAYSTNAEIRLHAPQADDAEDFSGWATQADGVIDSHLRGFFTVPLSAPYPQLIVNCSSMLAAGYFLKAQYSQINQTTPEYPKKLCEKAAAILLEIKTDPSLLGIPLREIDSDDYDNNGILVAGGDPIFGLGDETTW